MPHVHGGGGIKWDMNCNNMLEQSESTMVCICMGGIKWDMHCNNMLEHSESTMVCMRDAMRCSGSNASP